MISRNKRTVRWRRLVGVIVGGYFVFWTLHSAWQWWQVSQQEALVQARIQAVQQQNRQLSGELHQLQNPAKVQAVLSGQAPAP